jgi:hypothetical protein
MHSRRDRPIVGGKIIAATVRFQDRRMADLEARLTDTTTG